MNGRVIGLFLLLLASCGAAPDRVGIGVERNFGTTDFEGEADPWQDSYMVERGVVVSGWLEWDLNDMDYDNTNVVRAIYGANRVPIPEAIKAAGVAPNPAPQGTELTTSEKMKATAEHLSADWRAWVAVVGLILLVALVTRKKK